MACSAPVEAPLIETAHIQDIFADDLAKVQILGGGNVRFMLYRNRYDLEGGNQPIERELVCSVVMATEAVWPAIALTVTALGGQVLLDCLPMRPKLAS